jgi:hypothetical protein
MWPSCSFGLSATSQQYFSLKTNQPPATSQQYFSLRTNQHQPSVTSQTNRLVQVNANLLRKEMDSNNKRIQKSCVMVHYHGCTTKY